MRAEMIIAVISLLIPILFIFILVIVLIVLQQKMRPREYDERQLKLRADGNRIAYNVTVAAGAAAIVLLETGVIPADSATLAFFVAMSAGFGTFAVFCIVKDVFFHIGEKGTYYMAVCGVIVLADGAAAVSKIVNGTILENGVPTFQSCNSLVLALLFLAVLIALLVRKFTGERDE